MVCKIVHISDLHLESQPETMYPGVNQYLTEAAELLVAEDPDLLIVSGDLTSHGSCNVRELEIAKDWLLGLHVPFLTVPGNHDLGANDWRGQAYSSTECYERTAFRKTNYGSVFSPDPVTLYNLDAVLVVGIALRNHDPDDTLAFLDRTLASTNKPVILVGHYPVEETRSSGPLATFAFQDFIPHCVDRLRQLILSYPKIRIYACGHVHASTTKSIGPHCLQVTAGGLGPGPSLYRVYTLDGEKIHFETRFGPGPSGFWERLVPEFEYQPEYHHGHSHEQKGQQSLV